jgi:hypothetical protein
VYDLIGGEVDHASTDEEDLADDIKVLRRLAALNLLAAKGWTPTLGFWEVREGRRGTSWEWSLWLLCETSWGVLLLLCCIELHKVAKRGWRVNISVWQCHGRESALCGQCLHWLAPIPQLNRLVQPPMMHLHVIRTA